MKQELSVVVPAYNEAKGIGRVVKGLAASLEKSGWRYEIIVVDDASTDDTAQAAQAAGAVVVSHPKNTGYGGALSTGIEQASYNWIGTIDGDCSYPPEEMTKLLPHATRFDMVVGARQGAHYWGSLLKQPARILFLALAQFVVGERIPDVNSGLRIFKKSITSEMLPRLCRGFSFSTTLTLSFLSSHHFVHFVPIEYHSRVGTSKVRYLRDSLRTLQLMLETIVYYNPIKANLLLMVLPLVGSFFFLGLALFRGDFLSLILFIFLFCWSLLLLALGFILFAVLQLRQGRR